MCETISIPLDICISKEQKQFYQVKYPKMENEKYKALHDKYVGLHSRDLTNNIPRLLKQIKEKKIKRLKNQINSLAENKLYPPHPSQSAYDDYDADGYFYV